MSTKISALDERFQQDINGEEFFPIIDGTVGAYHTYKINLNQLFQSGGYEKVTSLSVTDGATVASNNTSFTLEYIQEGNTVQTLTIEKYKIQDNDVAFSHIDPAGYITSTQRISSNNVDNKLATAKAVDDHIDYREALYDASIKEYIGDDDSGVLADFATLTNVADDFTALLAGVKPELNTFKKIEQQFDTIDYSDKIGTGQVNIAHFRINEIDLNTRLNIKDSAITANLISANAVTSDKIQNGSILRSKISRGAISNDEISDATITASKIKDGTLTPDKLSSGAPDWNNTQVNIPVNLNVNNDIYVNNNIVSKGTDFRLYNASRAGTNVHSGRALVHNVGDRLDINYANDYTGGVNIRGIVTVPDQDAAAINAGGNRSVVTKEYVDAADILLNPIAGDKIQDNAIALRHMSDNSVGTFEILDDSITSEKIENIGPQWNSTGDVVVSGNLRANGQTFTLGSNSLPNGNVTLSLQSSVGGSADIRRAAGSNGSLLINNTGGGAIDFSLGSSTKFQVSSNKSTFSNRLHITGAGSSTIGGTNFTNPALLIGSSEYGIAIDSNEIIQKGDHLHLGVADGASQNIYFKDGLNELATIFGNSGNFSTRGDISTDSGVLKSSNINTTPLKLYGSEAQTYIGWKLALYVRQDGGVIAPLQTTAIINSNNKALTTKEYVASEIAKVYPDDNYILKSAPERSSQSMTSALTIEGTVDAQVAERSSSTYRENGVNLLLKGSSTGVSGIFFQSEKNGENINHASDFGYIQYHAHGIGNTSGEQSDLVIGVSGSRGSFFSSRGGDVDKVVIDVPRVNNFVLTNGGSVEYKIWHDGNTNNAVDTSKIASNAVTTAKIASNAVTTANIANSSITLDKLANITSGFVLGKTNNDTKLVPIDTNLSSGTSHNVIASGQAAKDYTDLKVQGLATTAYVDAKIAAAKGTVHYIDMYGLGRTSLNSNPSAAQVTWAKGQLGNSVRSGDYVMARVRYYESYRWGNGTAYRDTNRLYIYRVSGAYPISVWTIYNSWYA